MKRGQFSQEKIVAILHQAEKGEQSIQAISKQVCPKNVCNASTYVYHPGISPSVCFEFFLPARKAAVSRVVEPG